MSRGVSAVYPGMNAFNVKRETNVQIPLKNCWICEEPKPRERRICQRKKDCVYRLSTV